MTVASSLRRRFRPASDKPKQGKNGKDSKEKDEKAKVDDVLKPGEPRLLNRENVISAWISSTITLPRIAREVFRLDAGALIVNILLLICQGVAPAYNAYLSSRFMDLVQASLAGKETDFDKVVRLAMLKVLIGLLESIARKVKQLQEAKLEKTLDTHFEAMYLKANLTIAGHMLRHSDSKMALMSEEAAMFAGVSMTYRPYRQAIRNPSQFIHKVLNVMSITINAISQVWILLLTFRAAGNLQWDTYILISMSFISPFVRLLSTKSRKNKRKEYRAVWENSNWRRKYTIQHLASIKSYLNEVVLFGIGDWLTEQFTISTKILEAEQKKNEIDTSRIVGMLPIDDTVSVAMQVVLVSRAAESQVSLGSITLLQSTVRSVINYFRTLGGELDQIYQAIFLANAYFELLETAHNYRTTGIDYDNNGQGMKIEARNLSFEYPGKDQLVLQDLNFTIEAGETVAIVGFNGSGKSTLSKLLCGLSVPTSGQMLINDIPSTDYRPESLNKATSVCLQEYVRFDYLSVKENVGLGFLPNLDNEDALIDASSRGGASSFISTMSKQYDTLLDANGQEGENTTEKKENEPQLLSGGQWQKLALARAFIHPNPALMILDEPSSSLDARAEQEFFARLNERGKGRTTIFISHRFGTVRRADRIFFLENGRLIEMGTHEELIRIEGGRYRELFEIQASAFA